MLRCATIPAPLLRSPGCSSTQKFPGPTRATRRPTPSAAHSYTRGRAAQEPPCAFLSSATAISTAPGDSTPSARRYPTPPSRDGNRSGQNPPTSGLYLTVCPASAGLGSSTAPPARCCPNAPLRNDSRWTLPWGDRTGKQATAASPHRLPVCPAAAS